VSTLLIRDTRIVDARQDRTGDVLIEDGLIAEVGPARSDRSPVADQVLDGRGRAVIPGLVNAHTHAAMVLFRGYTDDMPLMPWLEEKIWPLERHLQAAHVHAATRLACLEMLSSGTTTFHDMYFQPESAAAAAQEMGMRAVISRVFFEVFASKSREALLEEIDLGLRGLSGFRGVTASVGPHAAYTVTPDGLAGAYRLAEQHDTIVHFHLAETQNEMQEFQRRHGRPLVEALDAVGFLGPRLCAAHGIWVDEAEVGVLAARGVSIVHCPSSNMKLSSGWSPAGSRAFPHGLYRRAGVRVALGTDGAAANNSLDMFEAMKLAALLQKHATGDAAALTAHEAFVMATEAGADTLRINAGRVEPGRRADLLLIDLDRPYLVPGHDLIADLVYAGRPDCVETVVVDGRVVLRDRRHPDQVGIVAEARAAARDLLARAAAAPAAPQSPP
jgi:5-methylthioadenosine/S-adenosylhomocysteine deaminase